MKKLTILTIATLLAGCELMPLNEKTHADKMLEQSIAKCSNQLFSIESNISKQDNSLTSDFKLSCGGVL